MPVSSPYLRNPALRSVPPTLLRGKVAGEIKPHNARGISGGLAQLRRARRPNRLLVTYRTENDRVPDQFEVLLADPAQVEAALRSGSIKGLVSWYRIGSFREPRVESLITLSSCPTALGVTLEPRVRATYQQFMRRSGQRPTLQLPEKKAQAGGHDLTHDEVTDFLRELTAELERELTPGG